MMSINAKIADTYSIGNILRFLNIIAKNFIGESLNISGNATISTATITTLNSSGTTNKVYGAVFN
jgi:hypothetical protein